MSRDPSNSSQHQRVKLVRLFVGVNDIWRYQLCIKWPLHVAYQRPNVAHSFWSPKLKAFGQLWAWYVYIIIDWKKYFGCWLFSKRVPKVHWIRLRLYEIYRPLPQMLIVQNAWLFDWLLIIPDNYDICHYVALHFCISLEVVTDLFISASPLVCDCKKAKDCGGRIYKLWVCHVELRRWQGNKN